MGTLTRTLQDEYKKSMELCLYLLSSFYILSNYEQFHEILLQVRMKLQNNHHPRIKLEILQ